MASNAFIVEDRLMISRANANAIQITDTIQHGVKTYGMCACCYAPSMCPCLASLVCVRDPEYIVKELDASKYIYVRENSLEWNAPTVIHKEGTGGCDCGNCDCCGFNFCFYRASDSIKVLYFDDPNFDRLIDKTPCCNDCASYCCGGEGEQIEINAKFCCGCCYRGTDCPCVPVCCVCPCACCGVDVPCIISHRFFVEDAKDAIAKIKGARDSAKARMQID
jgi:hypothetical protein